MKRIVFLSLSIALFGMGEVWSNETSTSEEKPLSRIQKASIAQKKRLEEEEAKKKKEDKERYESYSSGAATTESTETTEEDTSTK